MTRILILAGLTIILMVMEGIAQTPALRIRVSNEKKLASHVMYFGNDNRATYGIDKELGELEGPPLSPSLDVRWMSRRKEISFGFGLLNHDFIPCPTNAERKDTFVLMISQRDRLPAAWILEWKKEELREFADSIFLVVPGETTRKVNMLESDSTKVLNEEGVQRANIYEYGRRSTWRSLKPPTKPR